MKKSLLLVCVAAALAVAGATSAAPLPPSGASPAGDFDGDGRVSLDDFFLLTGAFGARLGDPRYDGRCDLDGDGRIGVGDFFYFSDAYGRPPRAVRRPVRLAEVLKKVPRFARVRGTAFGPDGGTDETVNLTLIPQEVQERITQTPGGMTAPMVKVPEGDFVMGSNARELGLREDFPADESPIHLVYLNGFWIDKYEVTNEQYREFVKATGHPEPIYWIDPDFSGPRQPVIGVNWDDATDYCKWRGMFLPTEAQWEKAARGVDGRKYPWGNEFPDVNEEGIVGYDQLADGNGVQKLRANFNSRHFRTFDVGSFPRGVSPYGVWDMAGNVWEWCADLYDKDYYKVSPRENPRGPFLGKTRVVRGGAAHGDYDDIRAPYRGDMKQSERNEFVEDYVEAFNLARASENPDDPDSVKFQYRYFIGFRCVREGN